MINIYINYQHQHHKFLFVRSPLPPAVAIKLLLHGQNAHALTV